MNQTALNHSERCTSHIAPKSAPAVRVNGRGVRLTKAMRTDEHSDAPCGRAEPRTHRLRSGSAFLPLALNRLSRALERLARLGALPPKTVVRRSRCCGCVRLRPGRLVRNFTCLGLTEGAAGGNGRLSVGTTAQIGQGGAGTRPAEHLTASSRLILTSSIASAAATAAAAAAAAAAVVGRPPDTCSV